MLRSPGHLPGVVHQSEGEDKSRQGRGEAEEGTEVSRHLGCRILDLVPVVQFSGYGVSASGLGKCLAYLYQKEIDPCQVVSGRPSGVGICSPVYSPHPPRPAP